MSEPKPGWYPDPAHQGQHRYWDGRAWTSQTRRASLATTSPTPAADQDPQPDVDALHGSGQRPLVFGATAVEAEVPVERRRRLLPAAGLTALLMMAAASAAILTITLMRTTTDDEPAPGREEVSVGEEDPQAPVGEVPEQPSEGPDSQAQPVPEPDPVPVQPDEAGVPDEPGVNDTEPRDAEGRSGGLAGAPPPQVLEQLVRDGETYVPIDDTNWTPAFELNVIVAERNDGLQHAFFFVDGARIGTDTWAPSRHITVMAAHSRSVQLAYGTFDPGDDRGAPPTGVAHVRYVWDGTSLQPQDPIPPDDPVRPGARR